ncbi:MAG: DNA polymerase II [Spirochaetales bacterium]|nr:DNA polymerase II [Spirochaetales bacterium]
MTPDGNYTGFIVHAFVQRVPGRDSSRLAYLGRLCDGKTFAAVFEPFRPHFYVRESENADACQVLSSQSEPTTWTTMDGEPVLRMHATSISELKRQAGLLGATGVRTYEADFSPADPRLMDSRVHGSVTITGPPVEGRHVDLVFREPGLGPSDWDPRLEVLSLDIETNPRTDEILAVGLVNTAVWADQVREVHLLGTDHGEPWIIGYDGEADLLRGVVKRIAGLDPDIVTGWNVIDFDFEFIARRLSRYGIPFAISRSDQATSFLEASRDETGRRQNAGVMCHGRQVIDGLRLLRYGPQRFPDRKLDSVARAVLGEGKTITAETSREKIDTLLSLYADDPVRFCDYCRTDAELVLRILDKTGLLDLTVRRCLLTGISLNRAWTSIPAFEFLYTEAMHAQSMVAPTSGVDRLPQGEAPGGAILKPQPGLFPNVLVFDFKSLYPSITRTFNIDPLGYVDTEEGYPEGASPPPVSDTITAPNGARFRRDGGILPDLLDRFWQSRDQAKADGDAVASFVYKIIMNSFYGVLGSSGCRFAGAPLAGAITGFGQYILHWTRDRLTGRGYKVLYGDTDSLFVLAARDPGAVQELFSTGDRLCAEINGELSEFVRTHFDLESHLQLEFEKVYHRFYLPRIRHTAAPADGEEVRGRAKGYAGRHLERSGEIGELEIKGMEAIRSDWTEAAGSLQTALLSLLFADAPNTAVEECIRKTLGRLQAGELDESLVYSRRLRKPVESYTKTSPPHVQAARLLPRDQQEGTIDYVVTVSGPQPISMRTDPIDYAHYMARQLRPIAAPICEILEIDPVSLFDRSGQLSLF